MAWWFSNWKADNSWLEWKAATPAGIANVFCTESEAAGAWGEDPGLSEVREAAEAMPAERVRLERKLTSPK